MHKVPSLPSGRCGVAVEDTIAPNRLPEALQIENEMNDLVMRMEKIAQLADAKLLPLSREIPEEGKGIRPDSAMSATYFRSIHDMQLKAHDICERIESALNRVEI